MCITGGTCTFIWSFYDQTSGQANEPNITYSHWYLCQMSQKAWAGSRKGINSLSMSFFSRCHFTKSKCSVYPNPHGPTVKPVLYVYSVGRPSFICSHVRDYSQWAFTLWISMWLANRCHWFLWYCSHEALNIKGNICERKHNHLPWMGP